MIDTIRLTGVVPLIFCGDNEPSRPSDVWLCDVTFKKGHRYLIEAESGSGKTSLCSYIMGMRHDYKGTIAFNEVDIKKMDSASWSRIRCEGLGWLPQEIGLFPSISMIDNIVIKNSLTSFCSEAQIDSMIEKLGLEAKRNTPASILSIGQQQRAAFIRLLCQPADFLILDEPVSHLDDHNNDLIAQMLEDYLQATGAGLIVTSVGNRLNLDNFEVLHL